MYAFKEFGDIVKAHVTSAIPTRSVTMGMKNPRLSHRLLKACLRSVIDFDGLAD